MLHFIISLILSESDLYVNMLYHEYGYLTYTV